MSLKDFNKRAEKLIALDEVVGRIYDPNVNKADDARGKFDEIIEDEFGPRVGTPNYDADDGRKRVMFYQGLLKDKSQVKLISRMADASQRGDLIREVGEGKLAKMVFATKPMKTGDERHDKGVKAHEEVIKYEGLIQKGSEKYTEVVGEVARIIKEDVEKRLDKDVRNGEISEEDKKKYVKALVSLANNPNHGLKVLSDLRDEAVKKFEEVYDPKDEAARAAYTSENIDKLAETGKDDELKNNRLNAALSLYNIASSK